MILISFNGYQPGVSEFSQDPRVLSSRSGCWQLVVERLPNSGRAQIIICMVETVLNGVGEGRRWALLSMACWWVLMQQP